MQRCKKTLSWCQAWREGFNARCRLWRVNRAARIGDQSAMPLSPDILPDAHELEPGEVEARRLWARRRGRPQWLWPDVARADWQRAQHWIEGVARAVLTGTPPPAQDWSLPERRAALGLACYTSGMGPLLGWWRQQGRLSLAAPVAALLDLHLDHNRRRMAGMAAAAGALGDRLQERGITGVLLKGMHTAQACFPDPATRPLSDIDLLVSGEALPQVEALLVREGYAETGRTPRESSWRRAGTATQPRTLMFVHAEDPWTVDLHHALDIPVAGGGGAVPLDRLEPLRTTRRWGAHPGLAVLEQPLLLLHLAAHAGAGLHNMTLIRLVELHLLIRQDESRGRLDWRELLDQGAEAGVLGHAYPALLLCERLVPGTVPPAVLTACAAQAPARVRKLVADLAPARAQRVGGHSLREHFMWAGGALGLLKQARRDVLQPGLSLKERLAIYERRAWQVIRGAFRG